MVLSATLASPSGLFMSLTNTALFAADERRDPEDVPLLEGLLVLGPGLVDHPPPGRLSHYAGTVKAGRVEGTADHFALAQVLRLVVTGGEQGQVGIEELLRVAFTYHQTGQPGQDPRLGQRVVVPHRRPALVT